MDTIVCPDCNATISGWEEVPILGDPENPNLVCPECGCVQN